MAITINQFPSDYTPAFNPQWIEATSTQIASSGFMYRVVCTDLITSTSQTYNILQRPTTGELVFPAHVFSENFISHYVPNNEYGWQKCTNASRKIRINVGEYYGGVYYPGTNRDYIIWNGVLRALDWTSYSSANFVYNSDNSNVVYLSSLSPSAGYELQSAVTYSDKSHFLYTLGQTAGDAQSLTIKTYDVSGTLLGTSYIANPYEASYTYTDKYLCIDVGYKGLSQIPSLLVTGTYPIITASVSYYTIEDVSLLGSPSAATQTPLIRLDIECEPTFTVYTLHYLAKSGNFETLHFNKMSELKERAEKNTYRVNPNTLASNTYSYSKFSQWEKTISSTGTESLMLNTDWMSEAQVAGHREIITSPLVYIDYGSTTGLVPCKVLTSDILVNKNYNNKLFGMTLEVEPTYKNNYQRG
jgi:hypothetical protein